jgi:hypothetical protein
MREGKSFNAKFPVGTTVTGTSGQNHKWKEEIVQVWIQDRRLNIKNQGLKTKD